MRQIESYSTSTNRKALGAILESFDIELLRLMYQNPEHAETVGQHLLSTYINQDLYTYFILGNIRTQTDQILKSPVMRDFVLNLAERASVALAVLDIEDDVLLELVSTAVCRNKVNPEQTNNSLLVRELNDSLYVRREMLIQVLQDNFWLLVLWVIRIYMHQTTYYHTKMIEDSK